jgi:hypothetical protein
VSDERRLEAHVVERVLFCLVANRCLGRQACRCALGIRTPALVGCPCFDDDAAYAEMDLLVDALGQIAETIFRRTATLLSMSATAFSSTPPYRMSSSMSPLPAPCSTAPSAIS